MSVWTLGAYRLEREIGRGGMGVVYLGVHQFLQQRVAVKVLRPELTGSTEVMERFLAEARAASASRHPGIIQVFDLGLADGCAYIAMELLDGETLAARLARVGRLPVADALATARQLAGALAAAHEAGVIHRDLKPDNVFLVPDAELPRGERAKILDFGVSKVADHLRGDRGALTNTGVVIGTPYYMSPEQCRGRGTVDHRSDLYALGCVLFELLTGQVPFPGEVGEVIGAHQYLAPAWVSEVCPDVPRPVSELVAALLAKDVEQRPSSAQAVVALIDRLEGRGPGPRAPSVGPGLAAVPLPRPTTLGASTGQSRRIPGTTAARWPWLVAGAVVVVGLGALVGWRVDRDRARADERGVVATAVVAAVASDGPGRADDPWAPGGGDEGQDRAAARARPPAAPVAARPAVDPPPRPAVDPSPRPAVARAMRTTVAIDSRPTGAEVWLNGRRLGVTPYKGTVVDDQPIGRFSVVLAGYTPAPFQVALDAPVSWFVQLQKEAAPP